MVVSRQRGVDGKYLTVEMLKRKDILALILIVFPWTLLIKFWQQHSDNPLPPSQRDQFTEDASDFKNPASHRTPKSLKSPGRVVEDSAGRTALVSRLLENSGLNYTHLNVETPRNLKVRTNPKERRIPRGTMQRNLALRWLRRNINLNSGHKGVVYFADDDNAYSLELFEEMRWTRKISVWPVAFVGGLRYESPKINSLGKVSGWRTVFDPRRPFAIDMAGFSVNLQLILGKPQAYFKLRGVKGGYQESSLLQDLVTLSDLEPRAANCTKVLVWHTRTERPVLVNEGKKGFTNTSVEI
ncbi:galactosylgalactosylxylosylprotein 3-beta-glucuronosyltransferase 1 isoform X2 [Triplophysa dalaica]|uniref:galactosylgalactosylxylosylprotein 3-beta-glucuronosyltransferase 1 isoform X2 n=1 Tax=Triplophysa dalaica TaxID=1582913 RepID=UPI0024DFA953|nr:galactosylgalactosylxylosylprotein 3-beta-glucuronosyltransferase 1 isoform X2 [Triplophysa dalaica]